MRGLALSGACILLGALFHHAGAQVLGPPLDAVKCDSSKVPVGQACCKEAHNDICGTSSDFVTMAFCKAEGNKSICTACGYIGQPCCRGGAAGLNFSCNRDLYFFKSKQAGYCKQVSYGNTMCAACGGPKQVCCPGIASNVRTLPCHYASDGCIPPPNSKVCQPCGGVNQPCCPGAKPRSRCNKMGGDGAFKAVSQIGFLYKFKTPKASCDSDMLCKPCGDFTNKCCGGSNPGRSCQLMNPGKGMGGICTMAPGAPANSLLDCKPCGATGTQCCAEQREGSVCGDYGQPQGRCRSVNGGPLMCMKCGDVGEPCCSQNEIGAECGRDWTERSPLYLGVCTKQGSQVMCKAKCNCPSLRTQLSSDPSFNGTLDPVPIIDPAPTPAKQETPTTTLAVRNGDCGKPGMECCPGSVQGSRCAGPDGPVGGYCDRKPGDGQQQGPLVCVACGDYGLKCCPGKKANDACGPADGQGFCSPEDGELVCRQCGIATFNKFHPYTLGPVLRPCCPGSKPGDFCTLDGVRHGFGLDKTNPKGAVCFERPGERPICSPCGHLGEKCCPGSHENDGCSRIGLTAKGDPMFEGVCETTGPNNELKCQRKCSC